MVISRTVPSGIVEGADGVAPVMVIGISGATWTVIKPMMADGALPALRQLMREGAWGVVESVKTRTDRHYRPQTAWPSLLTGKIPENHGITEYFHTYSDMKSPAIWDLFNARGLRAGIYSTPVLWPPPRIDGFVIPAPHARDNRAWPEELSFIMDYYRHHQDSKLKTNYVSSFLKSMKFAPVLLGRGQDRRLPIRLLRSAVRLLWERDREAKALILRHAKLDFSTALFLWLYRRYEPRFAIFTSFELDYVSHRYWRYHEPGKFADSRRNPAPALQRAVRDTYAHMDRCIGLILRQLPAGCIVAVVSEHGMAAETTSNEIGRWQYLIRSNRVRELAGLGEEIVTVPIARWIAVRRKDNGPVDADVERRLASLTVSETSLPLFTTQFHAKDEIVIKLNIHRGDYQDMGDIGALHIDVPGKGSLPITELLDRVGPRRSAMHTSQAVLIVKGPGIRVDFEIKGAAITDLMPTLLAASGMEVPGGLDGKVLDIFSDAPRSR